MVAVIESDRRDNVRSRDDIDDGASLACRGGHRLLDIHVFAGASGCHRQVGMSASELRVGQALATASFGVSVTFCSSW